MVRQIAWFISVVSLMLVPMHLPAATALHERRESASDLEVTGLLRHMAPGETRFVTREFLESLPQVRVTIKNDENFSEMSQRTMHMQGVYFELLAKALGAETGADAIEAICNDGYMANYPHGYMRAHRPILVLRIDGLKPHEWATRNHAYDAGYFVIYEHFVPGFRVLSHADFAQEPAEIVRLRFGTEDEVYAGIQPKRAPGSSAIDATVRAGFRIAQQNCFRCHNAGEHGGHKAGRSWQTLANDAAKDPDRFAVWIRNPQALDPKASMPSNPQYDRATLTALTRYFQNLAVEGN